MSVDRKLSPLHPIVTAVTERIRERSREERTRYLADVEKARATDRRRVGMGCANFAHAFAALPEADKLAVYRQRLPNLGIVTAYNDMLSAHQPYGRYPELIKESARRLGATAQVAGGVPAMCDGVTQGAPGMELSLFSRDVIAMATAIALSHEVFDAVLCLGVCDKIVPGLLIGALQFAHLPVVFVPAGPMASGLPNDRKSKIRQQYVLGQVSREALLEAESQAYHGPGTCTFYGTANTNQMLMEFMGLHLPGASFASPAGPLRDALTAAAVERAVAMSGAGTPAVCLADIVTEKSVVNGIVGLLATGGSTNHTLHIVALARAAGIRVDWSDFAQLSTVVPLLARVYPNGKADVNQFHTAGGIAFLMRELRQGGLLHDDVQTVAGAGLEAYCNEPWLDGGTLAWRALPRTSGDTNILRPLADPFSADGGLRVLNGNLGRAVVKVSAVDREHRTVRAPAVVFNDQAELLQRFERGELARDFIAVVRYQGPRANGMPELHKLTPPLSALQDQGFRVGIVTDGRMSGASGKVPAAIHLSPEALSGGVIGLIEDGDMIELDCDAGRLHLEVDFTVLAARRAQVPDLDVRGCGRELFDLFRRNAADAESGGSPLFAAARDA